MPDFSKQLRERVQNKAWDAAGDFGQGTVPEGDCTYAMTYVNCSAGVGIEAVNRCGPPEHSTPTHVLTLWRLGGDIAVTGVDTWGWGTAEVL